MKVFQFALGLLREILLVSIDKCTEKYVNCPVSVVQVSSKMWFVDRLHRPNSQYQISCIYLTRFSSC